MADVVAIILAGGIGRRFGAGQPKQLQLLGGLPILFHTLRRFAEVPEIDEIVIPVQKDWRTEVADIAGVALPRTPFQIVDAGAERNLSVLAALRAVTGAGPEAKVLIHDGVRPLVTRELIDRVLEGLRHSTAVLPVTPTADLVVEVQEDQAVGFLGPSRFRRGQTPLGFTMGVLAPAMESASAERLASASSIHEVLKDHDPDLVITTVVGDEGNIKITVPADRYLAGLFLLQRDEV